MLLGIIAHVMLTTALSMILASLQMRKQVHWGEVICPSPHVRQVAGPGSFHFTTYTHFMDGKMEWFYTETCPGGHGPHEEMHRFPLCMNIPVIRQTQRDAGLSLLGNGSVLSLPFLLPPTIPRTHYVILGKWLPQAGCVSSPSHWSKGETYSSHGFKTMARMVSGALQGIDTPTLQWCLWNTGTLRLGAGVMFPR